MKPTLKPSTIPQPKLEHMHHCSRAFGLLHSVTPDDDCQIVAIGKRRVVLPEDLDLQAMMGKYIGIVKIDDKYYVSEFNPEEAC